MSLGCKQSGEEDTRKNRRSNERTTMRRRRRRRRRIKTRLLFALRQRNDAAATMCPISRNFEFELCRPAAHKSCALYFDCTLQQEARRRGTQKCGRRGKQWNHRRELRVGVSLDAPHSAPEGEENRRSEMWPSLPRSLTPLSPPLHFHGFGADARSFSTDGRRRDGTRSLTD